MLADVEMSEAGHRASMSGKISCDKEFEECIMRARTHTHTHTQLTSGGVVG